MKARTIAIVLLVLTATIIIFFLTSIWFDGFRIWGHGSIEFDKTGEVGDFIGGVVGTIINAAAFYFLYLTLNEQRIATREQASSFENERFENKFFDLIKMHRDNVAELKYTKYYQTDFQLSEGRKVMRVIFHEFIECYREVKKFSNSSNSSDYLLPKYETALRQIIQANKLKCNVIEMAIIDIAYSIVFFGVGIEGEAVLRDRFKKKYNSVYFYRLLAYIKLKPKKENGAQFAIWDNFRQLDLKDLRNIVEEVYVHRSHTKLPSELSNTAQDLLASKKFEKYYGGHQHRLGHYFRHLYQTYKFLNNSTVIDFPQKYFYGKTLRAQLSTYEQGLLFINSVSSLGMKWEYKAEAPDQQVGNTNVGERRVITRYNLIKNLPGNHIYGITYRKYYPRVIYENNED